MNPWVIVSAASTFGAIVICLKAGAWEFALGILLVFGLIGIGVFAETMGFDPHKKEP